MKLSIKTLILVSLLPVVVLSGCNDNDSTFVDEKPMEPEPIVYRYEVTVSNLTYAQPLSPVAVILHDEGSFWQIGEAASVALETLAESGDNASLLAQEQVLAAQSGVGLIMPGMSETIEVMLTDNQPELISIATMLVNTNDAFSGVNAMNLSHLQVGESISLTTRSYDAGTEKNSELVATIPGPASSGAGEGFNEMRDDLNRVGMHAGVVSVDDGLSTSALSQAHKFDNPTLLITISRLE
ncbi:spondin domain-containing protein [Colwelliaceae bacterium 6441]